MANKCYIYTHSDDYFYNGYTYNSYYEDYECEVTISTVCDPNWKSIYGDGCDYYAGSCTSYSNEQLLYHSTSSTTGGVMTALNCPVCGCGEDGPVRMGDRVPVGR